ncbi:hypothetical protein F2Q70_00018639 [Brassica cretica]|uniref:Uncharacterized protein n=1 Tax=Brassica cretica TaxID=69181 RepID=A0A8S9HTK1_BRACR|nr:hypothetical protein F2Q70_00018639 [Brassica cretica]
MVSSLMELVLPIYNRPRTLLFRQRLQFHHERRVDAVGEVEEVGEAGHSEDGSIDGFMGFNHRSMHLTRLPAHDLPSIDGFFKLNPSIDGFFSLSFLHVSVRSVVRSAL